MTEWFIYGVQPGPPDAPYRDNRIIILDHFTRPSVQSDLLPGYVKALFVRKLVNSISENGRLV